MNHKHTIGIVVLLSCMGSLVATSPDIPSLSQGEYDQLLAGQNITRSVIWKDSVSSLAPKGSLAEQKTIEAEQRAQGISVASLGLVPYPKLWASQSESQRQVELFNLLHNVSSLQGLQYGSSKQKTLFRESYTLSDPENKRSRIKDKVVDALPSSDTSFVCQDDAIFGDNVYRHEYQISAKEIFVDITNLTTLKFLGISFVKPQDLSLCLSATQTEKGILLYTRTTLATTEPKVSFLFWNFNLAVESMRRMVAYQDWFRTMV